MDFGPALIVLASASASAFAADAPGSPVFPVQQQGSEKRHAEKVARIKAEKFDLLMIGDSITHNFDHPPFKAVWDQFFAPRKAISLGYSGGRTENILWNLQDGELEGQSPKVVTLLIGTNNTDDANYPVVHTPEQVAEGTAAIVKLLRKKCPESKILLLRIFPRTNVYKKPDGSERGSALKRFAANLKAGELVSRLADGKDVFFLDVNHVFLKPDGTLDPELVPDLLHPGPEGALAWARAMEPTLSALMGDTPKEAAPANNAIVPVPKLENDCYDWYQRHADVLKLKETANPEIVLIGDSITHFWGGDPQSPGMNPRGPESWKKAFGDKPVLNLGYGWDRTQNVLWRLDHGEFEGLHPEWVVVNIGTNNSSGTKAARASTPEETAAGIREVILRVRAKSPQSKIVLMGVLPRGQTAGTPQRQWITELNTILKRDWTGVPGVTFLDVGAGFLQPDGELPPELMPDGTHPSDKGYAVWAEGLLGVMQ
jgi:lysophospholipase L1-like esterase